MEKQEFKEARVFCLTHGGSYEVFHDPLKWIAVFVDTCELLIFDLKEQPIEECHIYHS